MTVALRQEVSEKKREEENEEGEFTHLARVC